VVSHANAKCSFASPVRWYGTSPKAAWTRESRWLG
jgi:hypothetical protein